MNFYVERIVIDNKTVEDQSVKVVLTTLDKRICFDCEVTFSKSGMYVSYVCDSPFSDSDFVTVQKAVSKLLKKIDCLLGTHVML